ncbi:MAG: DNA polymerase III subunit alpha [Pyrinomonadaceae bacterium]|nr:DNA polymerase III subunit alpha [Pyrinomonadaceae bacterium]
MIQMGSLEFREKDFVHLHLHTDYSLLQGAIQLKPLAKRLNELQMSACAITDYGNMFGAVSFYNAMKGAGVRPVVGYEAYLATAHRSDRDAASRVGERPFYNLVLLAKNFEGYRNLVYLASKAFTEGLYQKPRIDREILAERSSGLIALSGGFDGGVLSNLRFGDEESARKYAGELNEIFGPGNFYLEIQDHDTDDERRVNKTLVELSKQLSIPIVATNDAHYLTAEDARAHEILLCIGEGRSYSESRHTLSTPNYYVKSAEEMWGLFGAELPEALTNTMRIAEACELDLSAGGKLTLPSFPIPPEYGDITSDAYFEKVVWEGYEVRRETVLDPMREAGTLRYPLDDYRERLKQEIEIIKGMGFPGYFLIVWEFIKFAVENKIPVGVGRGSAAGSLVAYCLEITGIDPLQYDLLFERFLNPERISMPDIDIDFCIRGRGAVIDHVTQVYGRDSVCQIITFGTMASKAAIKDVGRALNMPLGDVERIAKLIPPPFRGRNTSISQALEQVPELKTAVDTDPRVRDLVDTALRLEGCSRHSSVHAAGVVISPKPLHEIVPVAVSAKNELTSQYPMGDLEKVGLLKMDFLGLTTLTIIEDCLVSLREKGGVEIDWKSVPLNDSKTMKLFADGKTDAVFQFESSGMQEICRQMGPKELEDLSALNALYRPGPLDGGMIPDFIARFRGEKKVRYLVPEMEEVLRNTYGVLVYQEQIMQLAQKLAGYSLGEADLMRRAMGKKKPEEMAPHEVKFINGALERGLKMETAKEIFDLMAKFAEYGFNKSHSAAYALVAYQTAWLKVHHPAEFMAAVMSSDMDNTDKVVGFLDEAKTMGLTVLPPDANASNHMFEAIDARTIRYGLGAVKGVGRGACEAVVEARGDGYADLYDFCKRIDSTKLNRRTLEALIHAGALDALAPNRASLMLQLPEVLKATDQIAKNRASGMFDMFGGGSAPDIQIELPTCPDWSLKQKLDGERDTLGHYLSGHPIDPYRDELKALVGHDLGQLDALWASRPEEKGRSWRPETTVVVAGQVLAMRKRGDSQAFVLIEDGRGRLECAFFAEEYFANAALLTRDRILVIEGGLREDEFSGGFSLRARRCWDFEQLCPQHAQGLSLQLDLRVPGALDGVESLFSRHRPGKTPLRYELLLANGSAGKLEVNGGNGLRVDADLPASLRAVPGVRHVRVAMSRPWAN